jgi:MYXO-CTERM domain-containing protein
MRLDTMKKLTRLAAGMAAPALAASVLLSSSTAEAHFQLIYPPPWIQQDSFGDPQKASPCGTDSTTSGTATGDVTTFAPGQKITLQFIEEVAHDGWYRISLSYANRTDLVDPTYETNPPGCLATSPGFGCNSVDAGIESPPIAPVLFDGILKHAGTITTPKTWTYDITLPMETCAKCTLQVEQIMLNHPVNQADGPFTYHHCADIAIVAGVDGGTTTTTGKDGGTVVVPVGDGGADNTVLGSSSGGTTVGGTGTTGTTEDSDAGTGPGSRTTTGDNSGGSSSSSGGCSLSASGTTKAAAGFGLLFGAVAAGFRRRRRPKN